jgi:hypothetical protein
VSTPLTFIQSLAREIRQEKKIRIQIGQEEVKLSLFADNMSLYLKDLKTPPKYS